MDRRVRHWDSFIRPSENTSSTATRQIILHNPHVTTAVFFCFYKQPLEETSHFLFCEKTIPSRITNRSQGNWQQPREAHSWKDYKWPVWHITAIFIHEKRYLDWLASSYGISPYLACPIAFAYDTFPLERAFGCPNISGIGITHIRNMNNNMDTNTHDHIAASSRYSYALACWPPHALNSVLNGGGFTRR